MERRAFRAARIATGSDADALDIVQDAMLALVRAYRDRGADEWGALFHRILHSRINDWHRRRTVRRRVFAWLGVRPGDGVDDDVDDPLATIPEPRPGPDGELRGAQALAAIDAALAKLPLRQRQAFLLRAWEGLDVAATAAAMECSEGSVKTHYSRAVHALREQLGGHWP